MKIAAIAFVPLAWLAGATRADAQTAPPPPPRWDAQLGASFVGTSGNAESSTLGIDFASHRRWPAWRIEATANSVRATDDGERVAERYLGGFRADRRLNTLLSLSFGERAERDRLSGIDFRSILDASLGWAFVRAPRWTLDAATGIAWKHERAVPGVTTNRPTGVLQALSRVPLGGAGEATQRFTYYPDFEQPEDYRTEAEFAAQAALNSRLALKLGYLWRYTNSPVAGFKASDGTTTASVVLRWRSSDPAPQ